MPGTFGSLCPACAAERVPWEDRGRLGLWAAFGRTLEPTLFSPARFFRRLRSPGAVGPALGYSLVTHWIGISGLAVVYALALFNARTPAGLSAGSGAKLLAIGLIVSLGGPLGLAGDLGLAVLTHGALRFLGGTHGGFGATVRAICYGGGPGVLNATVILPAFFIPQAWSLLATIQAIREAHQTTRGRAATAVLVPALAALGGLYWFASAAGLTQGS